MAVTGYKSKVARRNIDRVVNEGDFLDYLITPDKHGELLADG